RQGHADGDGVVGSECRCSSQQRAGCDKVEPFHLILPCIAGTAACAPTAPVPGFLVVAPSSSKCLLFCAVCCPRPNNWRYRITAIDKTILCRAATTVNDDVLLMSVKSHKRTSSPSVARPTSDPFRTSNKRFAVRSMYSMVRWRSYDWLFRGRTAGHHLHPFAWTDAEHATEHRRYMGVVRESGLQSTEAFSLPTSALSLSLSFPLPPVPTPPRSDSD